MPVGYAIETVLLAVSRGPLELPASELMQKAAQLYDQGDEKGAATLRAAAEAMGNVNSPVGAGGSGAQAARQPPAPQPEAKLGLR